MKKTIILVLVVLFMTGCTSEGVQKVERPKETTMNIQEKVYEVAAVDWMFGNWVQLCNDEDGCSQVNLHETGLRSTIKEGLLVKVTEIQKKKGNRSWTETEYEYAD